MRKSTRQHSSRLARLLVNTQLLSITNPIADNRSIPGTSATSGSASPRVPSSRAKRHSHFITIISEQKIAR
jgi:hypothetical protein